MKTSALGLMIAAALAVGGCASSSTVTSAEQPATVTLTSAHADAARFGAVAWASRPVSTSSEEDLRRVASLKSRCEAANDDDACMLISRSRMR